MPMKLRFASLNTAPINKELQIGKKGGCASYILIHIPHIIINHTPYSDSNSVKFAYFT